jgi:tRNA-splicing ligase RtcB
LRRSRPGGISSFHLAAAEPRGLHLPNPWHIPVDICAAPDVPIEAGAVDEILTVLQSADTLERLGGDAAITHRSCSPRSAASYVLRGRGNPRAPASACHGAGRRVPRGAASRANDAELDAFLEEFRVVTPLDHRDPKVTRRADVMCCAGPRWR